jgi:YHS domain-containing protein
MVKRTAILLMVALALGATYVTAQDKNDKGMGMGDTQSVKPASKLSKVDDHKHVCMVTNRAFQKDQVPVEVSGKTYYGCCEMCKDKLANDAKLRAAIDPFSHKEVNKADAVIAQDTKGNVFYFENDANLDAFNAQVAK